MQDGNNNPNIKAKNQQQQNAKKQETQTNQMAQNLESKSVSSASENSMTPPGGAMPTQAYQNAAIKKEQRMKYIRDQMEFKRQQQRNSFDKSK